MALISPKDYVLGTLSALILYAKNVLPALFPFIFFNKLLTMIGSANALSQLTQKPLYVLYKAPPCISYVSFMSVLCGYPIGAKLTSELCKNRELAKEDCTIATALSSTCGPIFVIGTVGTMLFKNVAMGYLIFFAHLLGSFLNAFFYKPKIYKQQNILATQQNYDDILSTSMLDSIVSIACVGGYILIMGFLTIFLDKIGITNLVCVLFEKMGVSTEITKSVWYGLFEMTKGIAYLSNCNISHFVKIPLATFIVSFGGLCIALQSQNFLSKCEFKFSKLLKIKFTQAIVCTLISIPFCFLIK